MAISIKNMFQMKLFVLKNATRVVVARKAHDIPINFGKLLLAHSRASYLLQVFSNGSDSPARSSPPVRSRLSTLPRSSTANTMALTPLPRTTSTVKHFPRFSSLTAWFPGEGEGFNPIDDSALSVAPMGSHVQHAQVSNEQPGYLQSLNKWKFRMDWPHGNHSRVSQTGKFLLFHDLKLGRYALRRPEQPLGYFLRCYERSTLR